GRDGRPGRPPLALRPPAAGRRPRAGARAAGPHGEGRLTARRTACALPRAARRVTGPPQSRPPVTGGAGARSILPPPGESPGGGHVPCSSAGPDAGPHPPPADRARLGPRRPPGRHPAATRPSTGDSAHHGAPHGRRLVEPRCPAGPMAGGTAAPRTADGWWGRGAPRRRAAQGK